MSVVWIWIHSDIRTKAVLLVKAVLQKITGKEQGW